MSLPLGWELGLSDPLCTAPLPLSIERQPEPPPSQSPPSPVSWEVLLQQGHEQFRLGHPRAFSEIK